MSTRSRIGIKNSDGTISSIYCHFDGYPSGVGATLVEHYQSPEKVRQLIGLGDLSYVAPEIGEKHDFDNPTKDWCLAYGRDRGEGCLEPRAHSTERDLINCTTESWGQFAYLFNGNEWTICDIRGVRGFSPLKEVLEKA